MIGQIDFQVCGQKHCAMLDESFQWTCSNKEVEEFLNETFVDDIDQNTPVEDVGKHLLYRAGHRLGADVRTI